MKIMVFTEGTVLMPSYFKDLSVSDRVKESAQAGVQREERTIAYQNNQPLPEVEKGSVYDFSSYSPVGNAVDKLNTWKEQGATICYLSSRRMKEELDIIQGLLTKYHFPDATNLYFRNQGEEYKDVAERIIPDVLIEDDCASIGGEKEMTYPHIQPDIKAKIRSFAIPEFGGIDYLPDNIQALTS